MVLLIAIECSLDIVGYILAFRYFFLFFQQAILDPLKALYIIKAFNGLSLSIFQSFIMNELVRLIKLQKTEWHNPYLKFNFLPI
jgi:hypothetical protein